LGFAAGDRLPGFRGGLIRSLAVLGSGEFRQFLVQGRGAPVLRGWLERSASAQPNEALGDLKATASQRSMLAVEPLLPALELMLPAVEVGLTLGHGHSSFA
jgi:hypothetical protein